MEYFWRYRYTDTLSPQTDRQTDGRTDKVNPVYPPFNFVEAGVWYDKYNAVESGHYRVRRWVSKHLSIVQMQQQT